MNLRKRILETSLSILILSITSPLLLASLLFIIIEDPSESPLFLHKRGIDPAIATGPFITTSNDIFGILIYFIIAKFILNI